MGLEPTTPDLEGRCAIHSAPRALTVDEKRCGVFELSLSVGPSDESFFEEGEDEEEADSYEGDYEEACED
uniref:Uncharacterized protein n=1 Tax=Caldiarchaeum subterraneum TaxID=311458 RepID=E6N346_CALS0|nr:hypothetical protein HGMM_F22F09C02 [Candidatus Caldarchaeum subterraneum]